MRITSRPVRNQPFLVVLQPSGTDRKTAQTPLPGLEIVWPRLPTACAVGYFQTSASRTRLLCYRQAYGRIGVVSQVATNQVRLRSFVEAQPCYSTVVRRVDPRFRLRLHHGLTSYAPFGGCHRINLWGVRPNQRACCQRSIRTNCCGECEASNLRVCGSRQRSMIET